MSAEVPIHHIRVRAGSRTSLPARIITCEDKPLAKWDRWTQTTCKLEEVTCSLCIVKLGIK